MLAIVEVVIQNTFLHIDPVPSPNPYDFHGDHPPSKLESKALLASIRRIFAILDHISESLE